MGRDQIAADARALFDEHPDVSVRLGVAFADSRYSWTDSEQLGTTAEIAVTGPDGAECTVRMALVWWISDDLIVAEEVFWDVDSLLACGWAG